MEQKEELHIKEKSFKQGEAIASSSSSSFFSYPSLLVRHVVDGFAGYLAGLCHSLQNLKPAAPAALPKQEAEVDEATNTAPSSEDQEEPVAVENLQMRTRAVARPQGPVLREGNGGTGGSHNNVDV